MTKSRGIRAPEVFWTIEQEAVLQARYPHEKTEKIATDLGKSLRKVYAKANRMGLKKTPEYMASPDAQRLRRGDNVGAAYRYPKGHVPFNKGAKGISYPGCQGTQFKPGQKPHTWTPIGTERLSKGGYLQRKMADTGCTRRDYVAVHHLLWIEHNGPIPQGHAVAFKDGNKQHITLDNLELVSRAELMRRNSYHTNYPKEVARLIQLRGALQRKINRRIKDEKPAAE